VRERRPERCGHAASVLSQVRHVSVDGVPDPVSEVVAAKIVIVIAIPERRDPPGGPSQSLPCERSAPHSAVGRCTPKPRK